jgi:hypothetical protein
MKHVCAITGQEIKGAELNFGRAPQQFRFTKNQTLSTQIIVYGNNVANVNDISKDGLIEILMDAVSQLKSIASTSTSTATKK